MKKTVLRYCVVVIVVIATLATLIIPSFASTRALINKQQKTSVSEKSGYSGIQLECGSTEDDTYLKAETYSVGSVSLYTKYAKAELYKSSTSVFKQDYVSTGESTTATKKVYYDWYYDAPYLLYAQTRHSVVNMSDLSDNWQDVITLECNIYNGVWTETTEHINP